MTPEQKTALDHIYAALDVLYGPRLAHLQPAGQRYNGLRKGFFAPSTSTHVVFEAMVLAELYIALQGRLGTMNVFIEFPGLKKDRIDLFFEGDVSATASRAYVELKMAYKPEPEEYENDFDKLKEMIISDDTAIAVHMHFALYRNRNRPNEKTMAQLAKTLDRRRYWVRRKTIGEPNLHFYTVAFGVKTPKSAVVTRRVGTLRRRRKGNPC